ncbi:MAG: PHB depolymerase family esterase [Xanthobacteraceae bacterium]
MAHLQALRHKFDSLLVAARRPASPKSVLVPQQRRLEELTGFGTNPGNLRMFAHVPERVPVDAPLVVALHGCGQSAQDYDFGTGWSTLADQLGFVVVYPQQQPANNPKNCFSWFSPGDIARDHGEALSIRQMVAHAVAIFSIDPHRVFVTGLSAGGAMATVMLATYPEAFAGGAIIAGLPYGCAHSVQQAFEAMFTERECAAPALGDKVRAASTHRGRWPRISLWHGTADPIVKASNAEDSIRQWTDVHGLSAIPSYEEAIGPHTRRVWTGADGEPLIEAFAISGMAHGVPLATAGEDGCGAAGAFFLDAGISSTRRIADFWRLGERSAEMPRAFMLGPVPDETPMGARPTAAAGIIAARRDAAEASSPARSAAATRRTLDPNQVIAAAFKAAGLPIPAVDNPSPGAMSRIAPEPIIDAALKAAGLKPALNGAD